MAELEPMDTNGVKEAVQRLEKWEKKNPTPKRGGVSLPLITLKTVGNKLSGAKGTGPDQQSSELPVTHPEPGMNTRSGTRSRTNNSTQENLPAAGTTTTTYNFTQENLPGGARFNPSGHASRKGSSSRDYDKDKYSTGHTPGAKSNSSLTPVNVDDNFIHTSHHSSNSDTSRLAVHKTSKDKSRRSLSAPYWRHIEGKGRKGGNLIEKYEEKVLTESTEEIPVENIKDYIELLQDILQLKDQKMTKYCSSVIENLADKCTEHGLIETVKGTVEGSTSMYAMFYAIKCPDNSVTIKYVIHRLVLTMTKKIPGLDMNNPRAIQEWWNKDEVKSEIEAMSDYQRGKTMEQMERLGVNADVLAADNDTPNQGMLNSSMCLLM